VKGYKDDDGKYQNLIPHEMVPRIMTAESGWALLTRSLGKIWSETELHIFEHISKVLQFGLKKYGKKDSWQTIEDPQQRYWEAFYRHVIKEDPRDIAKDSGLYHWEHGLCNLMFLAWFEMQGEKKRIPPMLVDVVEADPRLMGRFYDT